MLNGWDDSGMQNVFGFLVEKKMNGKVFFWRCELNRKYIKGLEWCLGGNANNVPREEDIHTL